MENSEHKYIMTISRLTVDKLGVKLYDKVSAVIGEIIANSYDADATEVIVEAPMGQYLASKIKGKTIDKGFKIIIKDNGIGIPQDKVNKFYLRVGSERRKDPERGDVSPKFRRKVMGNKGVGKLAPFGSCQIIEVISAGGKKMKSKNEKGETVEGYLTAHLLLDREKIVTDEDSKYPPTPGPLDDTVSKKTGTTIILKSFSKRKVPNVEIFQRQLAQRFGIKSEDWKITLVDSTKIESDPDYKVEVGSFEIETMENTKINFTLGVDSKGPIDPINYKAFGADGEELTDFRAGFELENKFYPVTGWVAYSKTPYKDELMAGIRIYCRGKIASQTSIFNRKAGFTGEHDIRSYLVGELHADWLDEEEDLILTDRRDIHWSHDLGQAFQEWGQRVVEKIGKLARDPMKKRVWQLFMEKADVEARLDEMFSRPEFAAVKKNAFDLAKLIGQRMREEEVKDQVFVDEMLNLTIMLAPHITLDEKLREAAEDTVTPLSAVTIILKTARLAELSSFGKIAEDRVKVIEKVVDLKDSPETGESDLQELIEFAPWLINPQWSPMTYNQTFSTLNKEFQKYYEINTGEKIVLSDFTESRKQPDFVMISQGKTIQIIEIKKPKHALKNEELDRINNYHVQMKNFLNDTAQQEFRKFFDNHHITLVCDELALTGVSETAFNGLKQNGVLEQINWIDFITRSRQMHDDFLTEAKRQRDYVVR